MGLLVVHGADLGRGDVRGDREHRGGRAVGVVETVDQVQVARAAAAGADGELARQLSLGAGGEGPGLLVAHVHPVEGPVGAANGVGQGVEAVADDSVDPLDALRQQSLDDVVGDLLGGHGYLPLARALFKIVPGRRLPNGGPTGPVGR